MLGSTRHVGGWGPCMAQPDGLTHLVEEGVIDAVHSRLMSGKEATVYVVERAGHLGAAKVYRARDDRTFKKVSSYIEGRNQTRNSRDRRAMANKSSYGRELMEEGWQDTEFRALRAAFDAGVRVPEPFFLYDNVLFMELLVDDTGRPAPRLADLAFTAEQATHLHLEVFLQVKGLLETGRIHGDLSAYNVLMAAKGPTIIDLPQVVDVAGNNNAGHILQARSAQRDRAPGALRCPSAALRRLRRRPLPPLSCAAPSDQVVGPEESAPHSRHRRTARARRRAGTRRTRQRRRAREARPGPAAGTTRAPAPARVKGNRARHR